MTKQLHEKTKKQYREFPSNDLSVISTIVVSEEHVKGTCCFHLVLQSSPLYEGFAFSRSGGPSRWTDG